MGLLELAIIAFVVSFIFGGLGFTGAARGAAAVTTVLFGFFLITGIILLVLHAFGGKFPTP